MLQSRSWAIGGGGCSLVRVLRVLGPGLAAWITLAPAVVAQPAQPPQPPQSAKPPFQTHPPGVFKADYGHAKGDFTRYAPGLRFPILAAPTTLNSQVKSPGGRNMGGSQCAPENYNEVWWDTFCEERSASRASLNCTSRKIHQGVDIRAGTSETCQRLVRGERRLIPVVAVLDGVVDHIGSFSVRLKTALGEFKYLHLDMSALAIKQAPQRVKAGDLIGYLSNDYGGEQTTFHLHFEHWMNIAGIGNVPVPVYCDLVLAYERDRGRSHVMLGGKQRCDGTATGPAAADPVAAPVPAPPAGVATGPASGGTGTPAASAGPPPSPANDPLPAQRHSYWRHNGSQMRLDVEGDRRAFVYEVPRDTLGDVVKPGTLLFTGLKIGNAYKGRAFSFKSGCAPVDYAVEGPVDTAGRRVRLRGERPVLGADCKVLRLDAEIAHFVFERAVGEEPAGPISTRPTPAIAAAPVTVAPGGAPPQPPSSEAPPPARPAPAVSPAPSPSPAPAPALAPPAVPPASASATATGSRITPRCSRAECIDRDALMATFATFYRARMKRDLSRWQIDAVMELVNVWDTTPALQKKERLAYILGTVFHETTGLLYPTRECSCRTNAGAIACSKRLFDNGRASYKYYLRDAETGHAYYGRGQTQLTLKDNFIRVGRSLGLGDRLKWVPDEALTLPVSSRNSVLGLYNGWYRGGIGLKDFAFAADDDWVRARDVLIARRVAANEVARHGRALLAGLREIPAADFRARYGAAAVVADAVTAAVGGLGLAVPAVVPAPAVSAQPPPPVAPTPAAPPPAAATPAAAPKPPAPPPVSPTATKPPPNVSPPMTAPPAATPPAAAVAAALRTLDAAVGDLSVRIADLSGQLAALRRLVDVKSADDPSSSAVKAADADAGLVVDFDQHWPPGHKESDWCRLADDEKAVGAQPVLERDDPVYLLYYLEPGETP